MFGQFLECYDILNENQVADPLLETLRLLDLLSEGALRKLDWAFPGREEIDFHHLAQKRKEGMPTEYILGRAVYMGRSFYCTSATLIPTEWTKVLVEVALDFVEQENGNDLTVIDMGTGCGNIAISIVLGSSNTRLLASDVCPEAVEIAQRNVEKFGLQERVSLFCGDLFAPFRGLGYEGRIDLVVCNPPYIPTGSLSNLSSETIDYEPTVALDAGPYGIGIFRRLITDSLPVLKPNGVLVFEIGEGQEKLANRLLKKNGGYKDIRFFEDDGIIRVISATKKPADEAT